LKRLADYKSESLKMSKQINRPLTLIIALCLVTTPMVFGGASGVFAGVFAGESQPQRASAAATTTRNAAIVATTVAVLKETSEIRKLAVLRPVKSGGQSRAEIERMVIKNLDEQTTPAEMHATEVALKKLGLAPAEFQYRPFIIKLLTEQVAGYYDTKARQFYLADWIELEGQKPVMAHELTHALQDQHFDLSRFEKWPKGDSDAEMAAHALIEGDATLTMSLYMARNPLVALAFVRSLGSTNNSSEQFKQAPRALRESLVFPYEQGAEWATRLYRRGGWSMVSEAFTKLPQSTEQILHPDKYFAYEGPIKVTLPDVRTLLGSAWKKLDYDVNGEWSYYLILDEFLKAPSESKRAAAGWSGDRYVVYERANPADVFMAQLSVWDTEEDAREFFDAYAKRTWRRYPGATVSEIKPEPNAQPAKNEFRAWQTNEHGVVLELRGNRVLVAEGIPDDVDSKRLVQTLWQ
jgi:hypothetical protein